jgi:transposase
MTTLKLSAQERKRLQALAARTSDAAVSRRAQALLWLASGHGVEDVTQRLCACRRTVYYRVEQYEAREADDLRGPPQRRPARRSPADRTRHH